MKSLLLAALLALAAPLVTADGAPPTLLQIAGVRLPVATWVDSVLLIVDAQREYREGRLPLAGIDAAVGETGKLLAAARAHGAPVIHVVHHAKPGSALFDPQGKMAEILPELAPRSGEPVVVKSLPNSFAATDLDKQLAAMGRKQLIVAGFMTHMCVSATVRAALDHGYRSTVVAGATAERDLPDGKGGVVPAALMQRAELAALADRFAVVVESAADISAK